MTSIMSIVLVISVKLLNLTNDWFNKRSVLHTTVINISAWTLAVGGRKGIWPVKN